MNGICTTIEQSKKLLELGLEPNTCSMMWQSNLAHTTDRDYLIKELGKEEHWYEELNIDHDWIREPNYPAWTLSDLLLLIPEPYQMTSNKEGKTQCLTLYHLDATKEYYNTAIEAVYNTLVKLYSE